MFEEKTCVAKNRPGGSPGEFYASSTRNLRRGLVTHPRLGITSICLGVVFATTLVGLTGKSAANQAIYDGIPTPDPTGSPSLGYQATSTDEFGDRIGFAGTARELQTVRVGMVSWAEDDSDFTSGGQQFNDPNLVTTPTGWMQELTFNIYAVDNSGAAPAVGSLLATKTDTFEIEYAPGDGSHPFVPVTFDFSDQSIVLPDEVIYGLAFNTQTHGDNPTGYIGPYNSLNFAVGGIDGNYIAPTSGTDVDPTAVFWDTSHGPFYTDDGAAGVDILRQDTEWEPYAPMVEFTAVPEPTSLALLVLGGLALLRRRRR